MRQYRIKEIAMCLLFVGLVSTSAEGQTNSQAKLAVVSRIYIATSKTDNVAEQPLRNRLTQELALKGFTVVTEEAQADAVLEIDVSAIVTLDGDGSIPNYAIYEFSLYSRGHSLIKQWKIKSLSQPTTEKDDELAVKRFAEKIEKDKKKARKS